MLRTWLRLGLYAAAEHRPQLMEFLFGGAASGEPRPALEREEGAAPGCEAKDGAAVLHFMEVWQPKLLDFGREAVRELSPLMHGASSGADSMDMLRTVKTAQKLGKSLLRELPRTCRSLVTADARDASWGKVITCVHQASNVSKGCIRCIPRFTQHMDECVRTCALNMLDMEGQLLPLRMSPHLPPLRKRNITEKELDGRINEDADLQSGIRDSFRLLVPCLKCMNRKTARLFDCLALDDAWKTDAENVMQEVIDELKSGNFSLGGDAPEALDPHAPAMPLQ